MRSVLPCIQSPFFIFGPAVLDGNAFDSGLLLMSVARRTGWVLTFLIHLLCFDMVARESWLNTLCVLSEHR
jgi:hypothetical protein